jgi:hypothetical protein
MGYRQPTSAERSLKDRVSYAQEVIHPLRLVPKKVAAAVGDKVRFRILSMDPTDTRVLVCKRLPCISKKGTQYNIDLHEQIEKGDPKQENYEVIHKNDLSTAKDSEGEPLNTATFVRMPIWVIDAVDIKGKPLIVGKSDTFETDRLMYLEVSSVLFDQIYAIEDNEELDFKFDDNTGLPLFDIWLTRKAKSGQDTWKVTGIAKNDKGYGKPWEEALGDERKKEVYDDSPGNVWDEVQTAMEEFMTEDEVKRNLKRGGTSGETPSLNKDKGADAKPEVADDVDADIAEAEAGDEPTSEKKPRNRFSGRAKD